MLRQHITHHTAELRTRAVSSSACEGVSRTGRRGRARTVSQRWADYRFKKAHTLRKDPFEGSSHASGNVMKRFGVGAKQPNSGVRKCVQVLLTKNGKKVTAYVPRDGSLNFIDQTDKVLLSGFGRSGKTVGDIPGCRFKVVSVAETSLLAIFRGIKEKRRL